MSPGPPENRPGCHYIGLTRSDAVPGDIFTRSTICCFVRCFRYYCLLFLAVFGTAGFKKLEFLRLSEVRRLYFPGFISGISERSEALKSLGWVERYARPAQQGSQTNARIIAPPKQGLATDHTGGCSHYAAAIRKYWKIRAWRPAIASASPLSASFSSA